MKKTTKILKNTLLVLLTIVLFTACNNDDDEKGTPCDYDFVNAVIDNATAEVSTPQVIKIFIKKSNSEACDATYKMSYKVMLNEQETTDGVFTYNNVAQVQGESFEIAAADFEGSFVSSQVGGIYKITFTIVNDKAATVTQTKTVTINYTYPPIVITPVLETNSVYAKQTAGFKYTLAGGGTLGSYNLKIIAEGGADLESELTVGGNEAEFENNIVVGSAFKMTLRPMRLGEAGYKIQIKKNGITETRTIRFNSKIPKFDFDIISTPIIVNGNLSQYAYLNYANMTFLDNYAEHIQYTLTPSSTGGGTIGYTPASIDNVTGVPAPFVLNGFKYGTLMQAGTVLRLTITNEYGYEVTKSL